MDGRFEISGEKRNGLTIESIEKSGYEVEPISRSHGAIEGSFSSPVIFKMWNTNIHEKLITGSKSFQIVPNGRPYFIDLSKGEVSQTEGGDLKVWVKRPEPITSKRYDWSCEMDVLNGGLETSDSYSMFLAPAKGYAQTAFQFEQTIGSGWGDSTGIRRFYIKLHDGKIFGRISIEIFAYYNKQTPAIDSPFVCSQSFRFSYFALNG